MAELGETASQSVRIRGGSGEGEGRTLEEGQGSGHRGGTTAERERVQVN